MRALWVAPDTFDFCAGRLVEDLGLLGSIPAAPEFLVLQVMPERF